MRRPMLLVAATAVAILALGGPGAAPGWALSCGDHPDGSPAAIASGTERLSTGDRFFDRYDAAVIGTISEIDTVTTEGADHGATTIAVDVVAVLGTDEAASTIDVTSPDPGWLAGYPYELGSTYLIPIRALGPDGRPNHSFLCDPITEVDPTTADELRALASGAGIPSSAPGDPVTLEDPTGQSAVAAPGAGAGGSSGGTARATRVAAAALTAAAVIGAMALVLRHRGRRPHAVARA